MKYLIFAFCLIAFGSLSAQSSGDDPIDLEIDGLIFDETRTRVGRDFYEKFYTLWTAPFGVNDYSILVEEQPPRGRSVSVQVKVKERIVSIHHLQPREEMIENAAKLAVRRAVQYLNQYNQMQTDLEDGDQSGSGIY